MPAKRITCTYEYFLEQGLMNFRQTNIHFKRQDERVDLFTQSVCLVWKHNPLEHETLEGKPEKRGIGKGSSSVTGGGRGREGAVNGTNCGGK